ncbi:hypothetical protein ACA910_015085 [Epithemia clementina (nom. ined.)]
MSDDHCSQNTVMGANHNNHQKATGLSSPSSSPPASVASDIAEDDLHRGFDDKYWLVHKFGGTSVANANCFACVADIIESQAQVHNNNNNNGKLTSSNRVHDKPLSLAVVVSAIGGKPKTTDLLLESVTLAAERQDVESTLQQIIEKQQNCLDEMFADNMEEHDRLLKIIQKDVQNIADILRTVALMKWKASRISELVSGYGELWSTQILASYLQLRQNAREMAVAAASLVEAATVSPEDDAVVSPDVLDVSNNSNKTNNHYQDPSPRHCHHEFVYIDARRLIVVDEEAVQSGAIEWEVSQAKLKEVYDEEWDTLKKRSDQKYTPSNTILHMVVTGYVASNTEGVATTLQRDGSDYSASIMGRLLQANAITIWTDVNGVLTADPRRVPHSQVVPEVSYNEAMELAYFGAKVIHPKTMQPAISAKPYQIPIYIRNTFEPSFPGTRIFTTSTRHFDLDRVVCGFSSVENMALINVEGSGLIGVIGVAKRLFGRLEENKINVTLISQASSEHTITFATVADKAAMAKATIEEEFHRELKANHISSVDVIAPCAIIAAVGDGMARTTGVSARFFSALGDAKINVLAVAQGSSERNISAVVLSQDSTRALRAVHAAFRLSHTTIRVGIVGMNDLGQSLLRLLDSQREALRTTFDLELQVCVIFPKTEKTKGDMVLITRDKDGGSESISSNDYELAMMSKEPKSANTSIKKKTSFTEKETAHWIASQGLGDLSKHLFRIDYANHVIFDCTNDEEAGQCHAQWLREGINVVSANNTGLSGPKEQRTEINAAEKALGKQSAQYLVGVTVGGALPIISTMRSLLQSGDRIRRVDGILSVSLSFIMFRISPPADFSACSLYDQEASKGAFRGDFVPSIGKPCSFSEAVKEAIDLGLMEEDPTKDLNNEYTSRVLMILAGELGLKNLELADIQNSSEKVVESMLDSEVDYHNLSPTIDEEVKKRVDAARSRGCVLRHVASINVKERRVEIKLVEVPDHHAFAVNPPSCECVRFFTQRHMAYPLTIQGPSAGADSTASALLAELLQMMRSKSSPRSVALSHSGSSSMLRPSSSAASILPKVGK